MILRAVAQDNKEKAPAGRAHLGPAVDLAVGQRPGLEGGTRLLGPGGADVGGLLVALAGGAGLAAGQVQDADRCGGRWDRRAQALAATPNPGSGVWE
jgi:hypothetical protein